MTDSAIPWYEFFAGGGMARLGLGPQWDCIFANELSPKKAASYRACFGDAPELKVVVLRELAVPHTEISTPEQMFAAWQSIVPRAEWFDPTKECMVEFFLNTRRRLEGFQLVALGTLDSVCVTPREIYRPAIANGASAILVAHNHPSGDRTPSDADIKVTRDLIKAGQVIRIELLDHLIIGKSGYLGSDDQGYSSLRNLGYFFT
jgi:DNA repair protein RadC